MTGVQQSVKHDGATQVAHFTAQNVRDFAGILNTPFNHMTETINGTAITVSYRPTEQAQALVIMDTAKETFSIYEQLFGEYPWETLDLVSVDYSDLFDGGMEYPQLVTINTAHVADDEELGVTVAHEIAHQWFYSLVGNDGYREPWLDESLTTFASYVAYYQTTHFDWIDEQADDYSITSSVADFSSDEDEQYGEVMYDGGAQMLSKLHNLLGEDVFYEGLRTYVEEMRFQVATTADFIRIMQEVSGENLHPFFTKNYVFLDETRE